jgi:hypothetical protein
MKMHRERRNYHAGAGRDLRDVKVGFAAVLDIGKAGFPLSNVMPHLF